MSKADKTTDPGHPDVQDHDDIAALVGTGLIEQVMEYPRTTGTLWAMQLRLKAIQERILSADVAAAAGGCEQLIVEIQAALDVFNAQLGKNKVMH